MDLLIKMGPLSTVVRIDSVDVFYRKHPGNWSDEYDERRRELRVIREKYRFRAGELGDRALVAQVEEQFTKSRGLYASQAFDAARYAWRGRDLRMTAHHLLCSIVFTPSVVIVAVRQRIAGLVLRSDSESDAG